MSTPRRPVRFSAVGRRPLLGAVAPSILILIGLTACSPGEDSAADPPEGLPTLEVSGSDTAAEKEGQTSSDAGFAAFEECLAEQGVDPRDLLASSGDPNAAIEDPAMAAATNVCGHLMASVVELTLDSEAQAALVDSSAAFAECARRILGVEVPDDLFMLDPDDPRAKVLDGVEPSPEQEKELAVCAESSIQLPESG